MIRPSITDTSNGERPLYDTLRFKELHRHPTTFPVTPAFCPDSLAHSGGEIMRGLQPPGSKKVGFPLCGWRGCPARGLFRGSTSATRGCKSLQGFQHLSTTCCMLFLSLPSRLEYQESQTWTHQPGEINERNSNLKSASAQVKVRYPV